MHSRIALPGIFGLVVLSFVVRNMGPEDNFLQKVRKLATDNKIVLIFDECTSGFRETFGGLHKKYGVEPDMAMFGKAMGNGYGITATIGRREIIVEPAVRAAVLHLQPAPEHLSLAAMRAKAVQPSAIDPKPFFAAFQFASHRLISCSTIHNAIHNAIHNDAHDKCRGAD